MSFKISFVVNLICIFVSFTVLSLIFFNLFHSEESKLDSVANVKSKSRSSSNNSTNSQTSSTNIKPVLSKMSESNQVTSSVAQPATMSMYQPSISMLARPVINTTKMSNRTPAKANEGEVEVKATKNNQVDICLR